MTWLTRIGTACVVVATLLQVLISLHRDQFSTALLLCVLLVNYRRVTP